MESATWEDYYLVKAWFPSALARGQADSSVGGPITNGSRDIVADQEEGAGVNGGAWEHVRAFVFKGVGRGVRGSCWAVEWATGINVAL